MTETTGRAGRLEHGILAAMERAAAELPSGPAAERLTHYCGRVFDVLRSPDFAAAWRAPLTGCAADDPARPILLACMETTAALVKDGLDRGEFSAQSAGAVARLLVSSLFARARWCAEGPDAGLRGICSRAVAETLDLVWPALGIPRSTVPRTYDPTNPRQ